MTLTHISSLESVKKIFFMNSTYFISRKWESNVLGSGDRNDSNTHQFARIDEKKIFHELDVHHVQRKWESNVFGLRRPKLL